MKSMMRRPSENRPAGRWKYVSPYGGVGAISEAAKPPVSEFESPKLKIAGNSHSVFSAQVGFSITVRRTKRDRRETWNLA